MATPNPSRTNAMKKYQPSEIEQNRYEECEKAGYFAPQGNGTPFSIAIPPPNVTGTLHMGHAFQHSLVDSLIRYKRMKGHKTLWQMGTDHAGIATQLVVSEKLSLEGISASELGREKFLERAWQWKEESGGTITRQLRRLGASLHWETERFTLDNGMSRAVLEVFVRLHDEGLIYRGKRLVNWDPQLKTSISDLEVESEEEKGHLWHFRYPLKQALADGTSHLTVATTRPETMLGDTGVAVHPDDDRYRDLVGQTITLPLAGRDIPIVADHHVDPEFGTGCVKITPAHDFNDYDVGRRQDLDLINIFNEDASLNDSVPPKYRGMDRFEARKIVIADMDSAGLLDKIEDHTMAVPRGEKSGVVVEPFLSDQWFVRIESLAQPAIDAVATGAIEFVPKTYENTFFAWMRDIQDWCISRQQWWGHRIPAWYDDDGNLYVGRSVEEVREKHALPNDLPLRQDDDVLDTWFSSALWTFSTLGWPDETEEMATFHSTDVMVTGHDIITFWVSRMIMMTLKFIGEVPFSKVYVTGLVTDADGQKMSKSKGNGLDPLDIIDGIDVDALVAKRTENLMQPRLAARIEEATRKEFPDGIKAYGTDALRFTFYAMSTRSRTIRFDMNRVEGYQNFCNKLWNATRFVLENTEDMPTDEATFGAPERWIESLLQKSTADVTLAMETYRFDLAAKALYEFIWDEYCDWYLEFSKPHLRERADPGRVRGIQQTLLRVLETTLRLAHPFLPFITEELWQQVAARTSSPGKTIMLEMFPGADPEAIDDAAVADIDWVKDVVSGTRNIRGEMDISFARRIPVLFRNGDTTDKRRLDAYASLLEPLVKPESLSWYESDAPPPVAAVHLVGDMEVLVPMKGLIDQKAELVRLDKEIQKRTNEHDRCEGKVTNPDFVSKAPADVVEKERIKLAELKLALEKLGGQRVRLQEM